MMMTIRTYFLKGYSLRISCPTRNSKITPKVGVGVVLVLGFEFMFVQTTMSTMDGQIPMFIWSLGDGCWLELGGSEKKCLIQTTKMSRSFG